MNLFRTRTRSLKRENPEEVRMVTTRIVPVHDFFQLSSIKDANKITLTTE